MDFSQELEQALPLDLPHRFRVIDIAARHLALIAAANEHMNLTRITNPREAVIKHVVDSVAPWSLFAAATTVMDAGTGAGFPGIPLAAALPDTRFLLVDSTQKKAHFVESAVAALNLDNVDVSSERAEDLLRQPRFQFITARAVAPIERALLYFGNGLKHGAIALLYKGPDVETEFKDAAAEAKRRNVRMDIAMRYNLPDALGSRTIVRVAPTMNAYVVLVGASFIAGLLNAMAGGGSFFSFPALLAVGVPPVNANATNTVALWPGQIASIFAFRSELKDVGALVISAVVCSFIGGIAGAIALLKTNQTTFLKMVPWLLLFATILFALSEPAMRYLRRIRSSEPTEPLDNLRLSPLMLISLTLVSFYIGYFGAGSGFLIITLFSFSGLKGLNQINTLKVICTSVANGIAVITFIVAGAVYWAKFPFMVLPALAGGYLGASYSRRMNPAVLRAAIVITGLALSAYYFRSVL